MSVPNTPTEDSTRVSAAARAYKSIKHDILTCRYPPGTALYEGEVAESLGMSKTPAREALGSLAQEGLIIATPRQGYRVAEITLADVQEIFQMRLILEPAAAELAAERAKPEHLQRLRTLAEVDPEADYQSSVVRVSEFHAALADACGNTRLAATLKRLLEGSQRLYFVGLDLTESVTDHQAGHRELVDAILKGNHHLAGQIAREHVETGQLQVVEAILGSLSGANPVTATGHVNVFTTA